MVGIRPGEKLHEVLISEDEARNTLEFEDMYRDQPPLALVVRRRLARGGHGPRRRASAIASDTNTQLADAARSCSR